jgi:cardiolipin synthase
MLLDRDTALIGSANLDTRSFRLNFELSAVINDPEFNQQLVALFEQLRAHSWPVSLEDLRQAKPLL